MNEFLDFVIYDLPNSTIGNILDGNNQIASVFTVILIDEHYNKDQRDFLSKVLGAINYNIDNDSIIRGFDKKETINLSDILLKDKSKYILSFGIENKKFQTQANLVKRNWNNFDSFSLLIFDDLDKLMKNIDLKRSLWNKLTNKFND